MGEVPTGSAGPIVQRQTDERGDRVTAFVDESKGERD